jgi:4-oxalocrotonate tautomerase
MPLVQVTLLEGRTADQKRKLAERITDAMVEEAGARREAIVVAFHEVSKESYASGGVLMADKQK